MSNQEDPRHPGGNVFDKVAGRAKAVVGRLFGNDDLAEEGELQQAKAQTAKEAEALMDEAEQRNREAELAAEQEANRIEAQRAEVELAKIEQRAANSRAIVSDQSQHDDDVIRQREHAAVAAHVDGVIEAAAIKQEAKQAESVANALETAQRELERENGESS
jgi:uncharacterized protein YjbJ (UPF0337 family)